MRAHAGSAHHRRRETLTGPGPSSSSGHRLNTPDQLEFGDTRLQRLQSAFGLGFLGRSHTLVVQTDAGGGGEPSLKFKWPYSRPSAWSVALEIMTSTEHDGLLELGSLQSGAGHPTEQFG